MQESTDHIPTPAPNDSVPSKQESSEVAKKGVEDSVNPVEPSTKTYGWAFWSRDNGAASGMAPQNTTVGQLAEAGSPSQSKPEVCKRK